MSRRASAYVGLAIFPVLYSEVGGAEPAGAWRALIALAATLVALRVIAWMARLIRRRARDCSARL